MKKLFALLGTLGLVAVVAFGCAGPLPGGNQNTAAGGTGTVQFRVTDAPRGDNVTAIYVKVNPNDGIQVHRAGSDNSDQPGDWISANITGPNPFELLALRSSNGLYSILGSAGLATGNYTQIRLNIESVVVTINGANVTATVPSGKIKFVQPFEVAEGTTVLTFDFDADKSINVTGNGNKTEPKVIMKPVIKLTVEKPANGGQEQEQEQEQGQGQGIEITTVTLPDATSGQAYGPVTLQVTGGTAPYAWLIINGTMPEGMTFDNVQGIFGGTPTGNGERHFTVQVTDSAGHTDTQAYTLKFS